MFYHYRLTSSISFYRSLLGIRSVQAVSDTELHLEYDVPQGPVILIMKFDELTKRLADAAVSFNLLLVHAMKVKDWLWL